MGLRRASWPVAVLLIAATGCSTAGDPAPSATDLRPPIYDMGVSVDTGGVTIRVLSISDTPGPGSVAQDGADLFAVFVTLQVSGQGEWIGIDRFGLRTIDGLNRAITDVVAGSIKPLGRLRTGTAVSGWVGFVAPRPVNEPVFVYRSKSGNDYEFALDPGRAQNPGPPRAKPTSTGPPPSSGSSSNGS